MGSFSIFLVYYFVISAGAVIYGSKTDIGSDSSISGRSEHHIGNTLQPRTDNKGTEVSSASRKRNRQQSSSSSIPAVSDSSRASQSPRAKRPKSETTKPQPDSSISRSSTAAKSAEKSNGSQGLPRSRLNQSGNNDFPLQVAHRSSTKAVPRSSTPTTKRRSPPIYENSSSPSYESPRKSDSLHSSGSSDRAKPQDRMLAGSFAASGSHSDFSSRKFEYDDVTSTKVKGKGNVLIRTRIAADKGRYRYRAGIDKFQPSRKVGVRVLDKYQVQGSARVLDDDSSAQVRANGFAQTVTVDATKSRTGGWIVPGNIAKDKLQYHDDSVIHVAPGEKEHFTNDVEGGNGVIAKLKGKGLVKVTGRTRTRFEDRGGL